MRNLLIMVLMAMSFNLSAAENLDQLALKHVENFLALYGKKSMTVKKEQKKHLKLRNEMATCATSEVLNLVLDDQVEFSNDLSFALSIVFATESASNQVKKSSDQPVIYNIVEKEVNDEGMRYIIERDGKSKLMYEVQCGETLVKGLFGVQKTKASCLIIKVIPKELYSTPE